MLLLLLWLMMMLMFILMCFITINIGAIFDNNDAIYDGDEYQNLDRALLLKGLL